MARSEFSYLRGIAQKRLDRLQSAGLTSQAIRIPKASELSAKQKESYVRQLKEFLSSGSTVKEARKTGNQFAPSRKGIAKQQTAEQAKRAEQRARKTAKQRERRHIIAGLTETQKGWIKGARKIGLSIPTDNISAFIEYMEYRYAQNKDSQFYTVVDDFYSIQEVKKKNLNSITADFARYRAERQDIIDMMDRGEPGYSSYQFDKLWSNYIRDEL